VLFRSVAVLQRNVQDRLAIGQALLAEHHPGTGWIILTGQATVEAAVEAVHLGAFDFVRKPLDMLSDLTVTVRNAAQQQKLAADREQLNRSLEVTNMQLVEHVDQLSQAYSVLAAQADTIAQDIRRAELIQRALLPYEPPRMRGLGANAIYRPCHNVGGDLYDVTLIGDRYVAAYIADAAGHGVSAAMLAVLFKHRIAVLKEDGNPRQPAEIFDRVNQLLLKECGAPGLFITAAFCLVDMDARRLTVASAGHPPILLQRAGGTIEHIYHTGPALGLSAQAHFAQQDFQLQDGDRVLLYTDGLFEAVDPDQAITLADIEEMLARNDGAQEVLSQLLNLATQRAGQSRHEDDITMLLLTAAECESVFDNGTPAPLPTMQTNPRSTRAQMLTGQTDGHTYVCIEGQAN